MRVDEGDTTQLLFAKQKPSNPNPGYSFILMYFDTQVLHKFAIMVLNRAFAITVCNDVYITFLGNFLDDIQLLKGTQGQKL